jgi:hypothetical protein
MATVGNKPQSWGQLAARIYQDLDGEQAAAARAKYDAAAKAQQASFDAQANAWGFVRSTRASQRDDWWSRQGAKK